MPNKIKSTKVQTLGELRMCTPEQTHEEHTFEDGESENQETETPEPAVPETPEPTPVEQPQPTEQQPLLRTSSKPGEKWKPQWTAKRENSNRS